MTAGAADTGRPGAPSRAGDHTQVRVLWPTLLARFFDNEMTDGGADVTRACLWLMAAMATPGILLPHAFWGKWGITLLSRAPEGGIAHLQRVSAESRLFLIGLSMVGIGALTAVVWQALLVDRRDVLVLGPLPLRHRTIITAKLVALSVFIGLALAGAHTLEAFFMGVYYGGLFGPAEIVRVLVAHFVAMSAAGLFAYLSIVAMQSLIVCIAGPRLFAKLTSGLQLVLVIAIISLFLALPWLTHAGTTTINGMTSAPQPWTLRTPPMWFLGLYEVMLGSTRPVHQALSGQALAALGTALFLALAAYPLAYRRITFAALLAPPAQHRRSRWSLAAQLPRLLTREPASQATIQFALATIGRNAVHRLTIAVALGAGISLCLPLIALSLDSIPSAPVAHLLAPSTIMMLVLIVGMRIAFALPAELPAAWLFANLGGRTDDYSIEETARARFRGALRRLYWTLAVAPPLLLSVPPAIAFWGARAGLLHGLVGLSLGVLLTEVALVGVESAPCTRPFEPGRARLHLRWSGYLLLASIIMVNIPVLETTLITRTSAGALILAVVFVLDAVIVKIWADRRPPMDAREADASPQTSPLGLRW